MRRLPSEPVPFVLHLGVKEPLLWYCKQRRGSIVLLDAHNLALDRSNTYRSVKSVGHLCCIQLPPWEMRILMVLPVAAETPAAKHCYKIIVFWRS